MTRKTFDTMATLRSICALVMLICILFFMVPHAHECVGGDCPLCVLQDAFSEIFSASCIFGILPVSVFSVRDLTCYFMQSAPQTLVHLKVKLSD